MFVGVQGIGKTSLLNQLRLEDKDSSVATVSFALIFLILSRMYTAEITLKS